MFLIGSIKSKVDKKFKTCFIFTRLFKGGELRARKKIKLVWFLFALRFAGGNKKII
jgi:hypothetical protein